LAQMPVETSVFESAAPISWSFSIRMTCLRQIPSQIGLPSWSVIWTSILRRFKLVCSTALPATSDASWTQKCLETTYCGFYISNVPGRQLRQPGAARHLYVFLDSMSHFL